MVAISAIRPARAVLPDAPAARVNLAPWPHARKVSVVVVVLTLATYVLLAQ
jgi:hypothetical protein